MKSSMQEQIKDCSKYPYLGISSETIYKDLVVLFYNPKYGTVIHSEMTGHSVGQVQTNWDEDNFIKFEGQIVLEN